MNVRYILAVNIGAALLAGVLGSASAHSIGSNPPAIGNVTAALGYDLLGNKAFAAGDIQTAKAYYDKALAAAPYEEYATLGVARYDAEIGYYEDADAKYRAVINLNLENEENSVNLDTEFALVLQKAGRVQEAITYYNNALDLMKRGVDGRRMDTYPQDFAPDGSDYDANELAAVDHIIRGLTAWGRDGAKISAERQAAIAADAGSPIVQYYDDILAQRAKDGFKAQAIMDLQHDGQDIQQLDHSQAAPI